MPGSALSLATMFVQSALTRGSPPVNRILVTPSLANTPASLAAAQIYKDSPDLVAIALP